MNPARLLRLGGERRDDEGEGGDEDQRTMASHACSFRTSNIP